MMFNFLKTQKELAFEVGCLRRRCAQIEKTMLTMAAWIAQSANAPLRVDEVEELERKLWRDNP